MGDDRSETKTIVTSAGPATRKPRVLVTGFGPFGEHTINASWESVQQLKTFDDLTSSVELIIFEIPVVYTEVSKVVPELWEKYSPDLVVHCGVSALLAWKNAIQIERCAHSHGYHRPDVHACIPAAGCCKAEDDGNEMCLSTRIKLDNLVVMEAGHRQDCALGCQISDDAGRYLCEFIYYTSLSINSDAALFIHVPPLYKPFKATEIARAIKTVILKVVPGDLGV